MGFIEAVAGKLLHQIKDLHGQTGFNALTLGTILKHRALLGHFLRLLFAHGPAQQICTPQGIAREFLGYLHHLFLIQNDAVGRLKYRL